ncbi:Thiopurine S-methyltransferase (TPMT) [Lishizhenia tianjinensis]|uniref:Thiopurine S-methyltransferase (TPMT) n=1 Tax=Lishizhenia tianjinensis TaxID=477690 RepID=A0A1I7AHP4_9FLAO|nr:methyltransferase domain-containing protein [Lishizhenia tianjinensis]SFT74476.1 Thiopurine S-methyltransferase (TPMT) [Lishizhenia tianjinensis]
MLDAQYWENRYQENQTGWDIGNVSTPIKNYLDALENKDLKILFPGAGRAHEAEYAHKLGFTNVYVLDFAQSAIDAFQERVPDFSKEHLLCGDFFAVDQQFDLIIEQTFFCAIDPSWRPKYVAKMKELVKPDGKLVGLFFDTEFEKQGPPFGGCADDYHQLFKTAFHQVEFSPAADSIAPRLGKEVWAEISGPH